MKIASAFVSWSPYLLSALRIMAGLLFLEHGTQKIFGFPPAAPMPASHMEHSAFFSLLLVSSGWLELIGGFLVTIGLFTRPVAFLLSGEMAVAYFTAHASKNIFPILNHGEIAVLYCFVFLYLAAAGGGPFSIDHARRRS